MCGFCKTYGHTFEDCNNKLKSKTNLNNRDSPEIKTNHTVKTEYSCFGCGKIGVIKSNCDRCNPKARANASSITELQGPSEISGETVNKFCQVDYYELSSLFSIDGGYLPFSQNKRPVLDISVFGILGTALIDTAAKLCIAIMSLSKVLLDKGVRTKRRMLLVGLAD